MDEKWGGGVNKRCALGSQERHGVIKRRGVSESLFFLMGFQFVLTPEASQRKGETMLAMTSYGCRLSLKTGVLGAWCSMGQ